MIIDAEHFFMHLFVTYISIACLLWRNVYSSTFAMMNATTWIHLEIIMLSQINQSQKNKYYRILLTWAFEVVKLIEIE